MHRCEGMDVESILMYEVLEIVDEKELSWIDSLDRICDKVCRWMWWKAVFMIEEKSRHLETMRKE